MKCLELVIVYGIYLSLVKPDFQAKLNLAEYRPNQSRAHRNRTIIDSLPFVIIDVPAVEHFIQFVNEVPTDVMELNFNVPAR